MFYEAMEMYKLRLCSYRRRPAGSLPGVQEDPGDETGTAVRGSQEIAGRVVEGKRGWSVPAYPAAWPGSVGICSCGEP